MEDHTRQLINLILDDFSKKHHVAIGVFEESRDTGIFSQKASDFFSPLCNYMHSRIELKKICDADHKKRGREKISEPSIRYCICGLVNISMPIIVDGECQGMILCGQKRKKGILEEQRSQNFLAYFLSTNKKIRRYADKIRSYFDAVETIDDSFYATLQDELERGPCKLVFTVYLERRRVDLQRKDLEKRIDNVAHEIQIYNQGALAATERLKYELADISVTNEANKVLKKLPGMLTHLGSVVTNLLWLSSTHYSDYEKFDKNDILPILRNTISYYEWYASGRDIGIELAKINCNTHVYCSKYLIEQVFNNLLHNAIKYSFTGLHRVGRDRYVRIRIHSADGYYCCISFESYGIKILETERIKIMDTFYRGSNIIDERRTGTGIGLSIVRSIAIIHRGELLVDSVPVKGKAHLNIFTFKLPYRNAELD